MLGGCRSVLNLFHWWALGVKCSFHVLCQLVMAANSELIITQRSELSFVEFESGYSALLDVLCQVWLVFLLIIS